MKFKHPLIERYLAFLDILTYWFQSYDQKSSKFCHPYMFHFHCSLWKPCKNQIKPTGLGFFGGAALKPCVELRSAAVVVVGLYVTSCVGCVHCTLCPPKMSDFLFFWITVKNWLILIIFGMLNPEKIWHEHLTELDSGQIGKIFMSNFLTA